MPISNTNDLLTEATVEKYAVGAFNVTSIIQMVAVVEAAAGSAVIATINEYTMNKDVSSADIVVDCLGDPGGIVVNLLKGEWEDNFNGVITFDRL